MVCFTGLFIHLDLIFLTHENNSFTLFGLKWNSIIFICHFKRNSFLALSFVFNTKFFRVWRLDLLQERCNNLLHIFFRLLMFLNLMQQFNSRINPFLFHFNFLIKLNDFFHKLHNCEVLVRKVSFRIVFFILHLNKSYYN